MQPRYLEVFILPSSRYKVMVWGTADTHIMDWRGCNYRLTPVGGQPRNGFETEEEARRLLDCIEANPERKQQEFRRARGGGG